ncbi:MAG TPA: hypothetical protein VIK53_18605 [Verrucomicrobiae bacterium]
MNQKNRSWIIWVGGIALLLCWGYGKAARQTVPQLVAEQRSFSSYTNVITVSDQWTQVDIPVGWHLEANWGTDVPLDVSNSLSAYDLLKGHMELPNGPYMVFRVHTNSQPTQAKVVCVFTKLP